MTMFAESIVPAIVIAIIAAFAFGAMYMQTGKAKMILFLLVSVVAIVGAGWLIEASIETDREAITRMFHEGAAAVEANDLDAALEFIDSGTEEMESAKQLCRRYMGDYKVVMVSITNVDIEVNKLTSPRSAACKLSVVTRIEGGEAPAGQKIPFRIKIDVHKTPDGWKVTNAADPKPMRL